MRQGCALSPSVFICSLRRSSTNLISISQNEIKLSQYVDDITLNLDGSQDTLEASLDVIEKFSKISGLGLNNKKTEALWIGSKARSSERLCPEKDFKWQEFKIKTLGVWLSIEPELTMILNFEEKTEKAQNVLKNWQYRRLSLLGKITILKSLVASQLVIRDLQIGLRGRD